MSAGGSTRRGLLVIMLVGVLAVMQVFSVHINNATMATLMGYLSTTTTPASSSSSSSPLPCSDSKTNMTKDSIPSNEGIHLVVAADGDFADRYQPIFDKMQQYATRHGYTWTVLGKEYLEYRKTPSACQIHTTTNSVGSFFFLKHCLVALWMQDQGLPPTDAVFVFDSDVVPYRMDIGLEEWAGQHPASLVFYDRAWNDEIMAGNYLVRNTPASVEFLRGWAQYEFGQPFGFSSYDNGAIHLHLLRILNYELWDPVGHCGNLYNNLQAHVSNLTEYWAFVVCTREFLLANHTYTKGDFSVHLLPKRTAWVEDAPIDLEPNDIPGPVFHHGVKIDAGGYTQNPSYKSRYNLTVNTAAKTADGRPKISCGGHWAADCASCPGTLGQMYCNGDCHWCQHGTTNNSLPNQCVDTQETCRTSR